MCGSNQDQSPIHTGRFGPHRIWFPPMLLLLWLGLGHVQERAFSSCCSHWTSREGLPLLLFISTFTHLQLGEA